MFNPVGLAQNAEAAKDVATLLQGADDLVLEAKMDGFRLLAYVAADGVHTYTRTGKNQDGKIPAIEAELSKLPVGTWLDGEIVAYDANGLPEWGKVQTVMGANVPKAAIRSHCLTYVAFDLLAFDGNDVRALPFSVRRNALETVFEKISMDPDEVRVTEQLEATDENHDKLVADGWEGSIVKRLSVPYASGARGQGWYKLKANDEMDVVIMGYKPGQNSFTGLIGALDFGQYKDCDHLGLVGVDQCQHCVATGGKILTYRGRCSGMTLAVRKEMTDNIATLVAEKAVISLAYMGIMPSGSPRHPQYKRFRPDKPALECLWT